jgi:predicted nucleic acid-binding protein
VAAYVDASAAVKLVIEEDESAALGLWLAQSTPRLVTSDLTRTELTRAVRRIDTAALPLVAGVLERIDIVRVTSNDFEKAAEQSPPELRSLDALHLASALDLADDVDSMLTYDHRLGDAAEALGLTVIAPS